MKRCSRPDHEATPLATASSAAPTNSGESSKKKENNEKSSFDQPSGSSRDCPCDNRFIDSSCILAANLIKYLLSQSTSAQNDSSVGNEKPLISDPVKSSTPEESCHDDDPISSRLRSRSHIVNRDCKQPSLKTEVVDESNKKPDSRKESEVNEAAIKDALCRIYEARQVRQITIEILEESHPDYEYVCSLPKAPYDSFCKLLRNQLTTSTSELPGQTQHRCSIPLYRLPGSHFPSDSLAGSSNMSSPPEDNNEVLPETKPADQVLSETKPADQVLSSGSNQPVLNSATQEPVVAKLEIVNKPSDPKKPRKDLLEQALIGVDVENDETPNIMPTITYVTEPLQQASIMTTTDQLL